MELVCAELNCDKKRDMPELSNGTQMLGIVSQLWFCKEHSKTMINTPCSKCGIASCRHLYPKMYDSNGKIILKELRKIQREYSKKLKVEYR